MKRSFRTIGLVTVIVLLLTMVWHPMAEKAPASSQKDEPKVTYKTLESEEDAFIEVCRKGAYALQINPATKVFALADAASGEALWYSGVTKETFSELEMSSKTWRAYMQSALVVNYVKKTDVRGNSSKSYSAASQNDVKVKVSDSGLRLEMDFDNISVKMAMEVTLGDGRLVVKLPRKDIKEKGDKLIKSVEVLPFLASVAKEKKADGYLVYPDGCGAISYFDRVDDKHTYTSSLALDIYGSLNLEKVLAENKEATAMLPIYGIKENDKAVLGALTKGGESARINAETALANSTVPIHRAAFELFYRNEYRIYLSGTSNSAAGVNKNHGLKVDDKIQLGDQEITYFLLQGDQADYSGMANAYRKYLQEEKLLNNNEAAKKLALYLTMFMGVNQEGAFGTSLIPMTTYEDAENILRDYLAADVDALQVTLRGWNKGGYGLYPQKTKAARQLGGKKDLKSLNKLAAEKGVSILLETELLYTNRNRYVAVDGVEAPLTNMEQNEFLLTPKRLQVLLAKVQKSLKRYDNMELALSSVGNYLYPDYSEKNKANRNESLKAMKKVGQTKGVGAVQGGNLYMLASAQQLYDLPMTCSMHHMTDEAIPLYFMVVSGSIPYTVTAGNRSGDLQEMMLKWIEYGAMPHFELTQESTAELMGTAYDTLFTSRYESWKERSLAVYKDMKEHLEPVVGHAITKHEKLSNGAVRVTYENGYRVLINYSDKAIEQDGRTVEACGYVVYQS